MLDVYLGKNPKYESSRRAGQNKSLRLFTGGMFCLPKLSDWWVERAKMTRMKSVAARCWAVDTRLPEASMPTEPSYPKLVHTLKPSDQRNTNKTQDHSCITNTAPHHRHSGHLQPHVESYVTRYVVRVITGQSATRHHGRARAEAVLKEGEAGRSPPRRCAVPGAAAASAGVAEGRGAAAGGGKRRWRGGGAPELLKCAGRGL